MIENVLDCPLCGASLMDAQDRTSLWDTYHACHCCGLVFEPGANWDRAQRPPSGWEARAAHLGAQTPADATTQPSVPALECSLRLLGPVYVETPNAREPSLSLGHFFKDRHPVYYEPQTLAIAAIMAGADDIAIEEVAGYVCALITPGGTRKTYEEASAQLGLPPLAGVAERMRTYFDPPKREVMGEPLPDPCFLCDGQRHAWRSVAICAACSAMTTVLQPRSMLDELHEVFLKTPIPDPFVCPDIRQMKADQLEATVIKNRVVLDASCWPAALLRAGADMVKLNTDGGTLLVAGAALATPTRKSFKDATAIIQTPFYEARHTLALLSRGKPQQTVFERWIAGEDVDDMEALRREAALAVHTANLACGALDAVVSLTGKESDSEDDWHPDPYLCGMRMGRAGGMAEVHWMAANAYAAIAGRVVK